MDKRIGQNEHPGPNVDSCLTGVFTYYIFTDIFGHTPSDFMSTPTLGEYSRGIHTY
jgi:hypothetical protein